jgi:hypothetical protein
MALPSAWRRRADSPIDDRRVRVAARRDVEAARVVGAEEAVVTGLVEVDEPRCALDPRRLALGVEALADAVNCSEGASLSTAAADQRLDLRRTAS